MQADIGTQQQWLRIDGRVPGAINVVNRYSDLTGDVGGASVPLKSLSDRIIFGLSRVCIEESQEILLLAANDYPSGASKLLRGLYERAVTLLYLQKHPEKAERFQHYSAIQEHRVVAAARKLFSDEQLDTAWKGVTVADVDEAYAAVKAEFQKTKCNKCKTTELAHSWDIDLASMASRVGEGMSELYLSGYSFPTLHAHATFVSAYAHMRPSERGLTYNFKHSEAETDLWILLVFTLMHRVFKAVVDVFNLPLTENVEKFGQSLQALMPSSSLSAEAR